MKIKVREWTATDTSTFEINEDEIIEAIEIWYVARNGLRAISSDTSFDIDEVTV